MVTGATGFVGRHVVNYLINSGHNVIAVARSIERAKSMSWYNDVIFIIHDLEINKWNWREEEIPDVLVHLAWSGLPNYKEYSHISNNFTTNILFLENAIRYGVKHLIVSGTCLEYGQQEGALAEDANTAPITAYGFSKDILRKSLELLQIEKPFTFQWMRLFYLYGEGQNKSSLYSQIENTIRYKYRQFEMSQGDQLRDFMPVEEAARCVGWLIERPNINGVINCSMGKPISVYDFVKNQISKNKVEVQIIRGIYPYPDYEPFAFWGLPNKLEISGFFK